MEKDPISIRVQIHVDSRELDAAIEKANRLRELLGLVQQRDDSPARD